MKNIFSDYANKYYENGYNVLPVQPLSKAIKIKGWQQYGVEKLTEERLDQWITNCPEHNIGIALGKMSGIIGLDFDHDLDGIHEQVESLLQGSLVKKRGQKGFTAFYKYNGEVTKRWRKNGQTCVELLSTGTQTVMPPSIHPDTKKPYAWITPDTLEYMSADDLTTLPDDFIEKVDKLFGYDVKKKEYSGSINFDKPKLEEVVHALSYVPCESYSTLITIGMALKEEFADDAFDAWDNWAKKSPKYNPEEINYAYKWSSFGKYGGARVGVGSIFHEAIGHGYIPLTRNVFDDENYEPEFMLPAGFQIKVGSEVVFQEDGEAEVQAVEHDPETGEIIEAEKVVAFSKNEDTLEFPQHLLDHAPGLPGEMAKWINSTAFKRQPILALGTAICAAGTLYAHKIASETDLRTNFMILGLAESGCGKDHSRKCMMTFFPIIEMGQRLVGKFASDSSIITALKKIDGVAFALMDEIGLELKALMRKNAGNHEAKILSTLMEMFSSSSSIFHGKQYADREREREDLIQPCLNIYGTTVPKPFYDSMTSDQAIDGFLARWLIFQSNDIDPPTQEPGNLYRIPENLVAYVHKINSIQTHTGAALETISGNPMESVPQPKVIQFTDGAKKVLHVFGELCNTNRVSELQKGGNCAAVWSRTREHAIKLALVSHDIDRGIICDDVMKWACELALYLTNVAIKGVKDNISDSEHEALFKRIHKIILDYNKRNNKPMRKRELARATKFVPSRNLGEIMSQMQEAGMVECTMTTNGSNGSVSQVFSAME